MSSEQGLPSKGSSCPDFDVIATGVGPLRVPPGLAGQMHMLYHNGRGAGGHKCAAGHPPPDRRAPGTLRTTLRHHTPPPTAPLPPPSAPYRDLIKQWERLLAWATYKTLMDFNVMPGRPAREASRRVAKRILSDYGPSLHNWLVRRT